MVTVEIEYCVPCGMLDPAVKTQRELLEEFGHDLDGIRLTPGHGGVFKIYADSEEIWDKDDHDGQIDLNKINATLTDRLATDA